MIYQVHSDVVKSLSIDLSLLEYQSTVILERSSEIINKAESALNDDKIKFPLNVIWKKIKVVVEHETYFLHSSGLLELLENVQDSDTNTGSKISADTLSKEQKEIRDASLPFLKGITIYN